MTIQLKQLSASVVFSAMASLAYGQTLAPPAAGDPQFPTQQVKAAPLPANWWQLPDYLPRRSAVAMPPRYNTGQLEPGSCRLNNNIGVAVGLGLIVDNRTLYIINGNCQMEAVLRIPEANAGNTALSLVNAIEAIYPKVGAGLKQPFSPNAIITPAQQMAGMVVVSDLLMGQIYLPFKMSGLTADEVGQRALAGAKAPAERQLTGEWWNDPALLPQKLARPLTVTARSGANRCTLSNGATVPLNSIVIPDTSHAYFLDRNCTLNPLITLPDPATSAAVASTGGRFPAPVGGGIAATPALVGPPPTDLPKIEIPPKTASDLMRVMRGATTADIFTAAAVRASLIGGVLVIADLGLEVYKAMQRTGLSATQVIRLATETPDGPYEYHLDPKLRPITDRAKYLSSLVVDGRTMGSCEKKIIEPMIDWMKQWCDGAKACIVPPPLDPLEQKERLNRLKMCLKYRIEIMDECFDGGDGRHRSEATDVLKRYRTCQGIKAYLP